MSKPTVPAEWIRNRSDELAAASGYTFEPGRGERVIRFLETFCRQSKGEWSGKPLAVIPWQRDFIMRLYGWRAPDGTRRFRRAYVEIPKKNGKSTLLSGLGLFELIDGDAGAEVYCLAYDRSQAAIVHGESERMVNASPALSRILEVTTSRKAIAYPRGAGTMLALSADVPSKDGLNPSFVIFDELHRQRTRAMWDLFMFAGVARREPLTLSITTAGVDRHSICYQEHTHAEEVNNGTREDLRFLGVIYGATEQDDYRDPAVWRKANPSLGYTLREEDLAAELAEVEGNPAALNNWKRLRLNIWTSATTSYIAAEDWDACAGEPYRDDVFSRLDAWAGMDLASTGDIAAFVALVQLPDDQVGDDGAEFGIFARFYCPESAVERRSRIDHVPYLEWVRDGYLTATPGERIDYAYIREDVKRFAARNNVALVYSDEWNATQLCGELIEEGIPVEFIPQIPKVLNEPTKALESWAKARRIRHGGNPALAWMIRNAEARVDANGNVKLDKKASKDKIDGAVALVNAVAAYLATGDEGGSVYDSRGVIGI